MTKVILGLPYLSAGALTQTARRLAAPVLVSASAFAVYRVAGRMPPGPGRPARNVREWTGWNTSSLRHAQGLDLTVDSSGYVAQVLRGGYEWSPESYVGDLCTHPAISRFAAMDLAVEPEIARDRETRRERIARTVGYFYACLSAARAHGISHKLMPVLQGWEPEDYLRCADEILPAVPDGTVIGIGSTCRRAMNGPAGVLAILDQLDRHLPRGIRFHLFGVKSNAAEAAAALGGRVASIDSQAYGVRARQLANERRKTDPDFSKTNEFVAGIMEDWYLSQCSRMLRGAGGTFSAPAELPLKAGSGPRTVQDALELILHAEINELIMAGELDPDTGCVQRWIYEGVGDFHPLPDGVSMNDTFQSASQIPESYRNQWHTVALSL